MGNFSPWKLVEDTAQTEANNVSGTEEALGFSIQSLHFDMIPSEGVVPARRLFISAGPACIDA